MKRARFADARALRRWLEKNHGTARELPVGINHKRSGRGGLLYAEALDEALCFGWIDGVRCKLDASSYCVRFTPRKSGSVWSNANVGHVTRLTQAGRMHGSGLASFAARDARKTGVYSFEWPAKTLPPALEQQFRARAKAWAFFAAQAAWYRRLAIHKIVSPKQPATRERWLERIIAASAAGRRFQ